MQAKNFASSVLAEMRRTDPRAAALQCRAHGREAAWVGIEDAGEFVVLFRLAAPSAKFNVMRLFIEHQRLWIPLMRGTTTMLAHNLLGSARHLWGPAVIAAQLPEFSDE